VGSVDGGYGWYTADREIVAGTYTAAANAKPQLWNVGADLYASYFAPLGASSFVKPFVEVRGSEVRSSAFDEQRAPHLHSTC
jgi:hypothetical protein